jgi:hypothetical protein
VSSFLEPVEGVHTPDPRPKVQPLKLMSTKGPESAQ